MVEFIRRRAEPLEGPGSSLPQLDAGKSKKKKLFLLHDFRASAETRNLFREISISFGKYRFAKFWKN